MKGTPACTYCHLAQADQGVQAAAEDARRQPGVRPQQHRFHRFRREGPAAVCRAPPLRSLLQERRCGVATQALCGDMLEMLLYKQQFTAAQCYCFDGVHAHANLQAR
jgi:hypothetical protein